MQNKLLLIGLFFCGSVTAQTLAICNGEYALCAASSATPTGKTITVQGKEFKEGVAICPVLRGQSIANLDLMNGSCDAPTGKVWSLFGNPATFPQAPTWENSPPVHRIFTTTAGNGGMSNMWSFPCVKELKKINGVTLAKCYGPLNESPWNATAVSIGTKVITDAPVGATYPVGGPVKAK